MEHTIYLSVFKKGDRKVNSNHRGISIIPVIDHGLRIEKSCIDKIDCI